MDWIGQTRRRVRPVVRDLQAILRWQRLRFEEAPAVFGNAKPKSGSHLLVQVLAAFPHIMPYRYVAAEPVRTITREGERRSPEDIRADLARLPRGVIGWGYVEPTESNVSFLCAPGRVNYFLYRDPRDLLVSHIYFATDMHSGHGMHAYYQSLPDFASRLEVAITGIDQGSLKMVSVRQRYEDVLDWLATPQVLCLRFEDFLQDPTGTLNRMLDQVANSGSRLPAAGERALQILLRSIQPSKSRTFRSGKAGGWRQHFTPQLKSLFLEVAGDLLIQLGYEENNDW